MTVHIKNSRNKYEENCREWMVGCSCMIDDDPETCEDCTKAFLKAIKQLGKDYYKRDEKLKSNLDL